MKTLPNEPQRRYNPLNDFLFHKVMGEKGSEPQLTSFLNAVLGASGRKPIESIEIVENRTFVKNIMAGKSCSLDVIAVLDDGTIVNVEVQLLNERNMNRRTLFYWSKLYTKSLKKGQDYRDIPDVVTVNIVGFDYPPNERVHSVFHLREDSDLAAVLTPVMEIHFVNVLRWRQGKKDIANDPLHRWLAWLDPESPPELVEEAKIMDGAIMAADRRHKFVMQGDDARSIYEMQQKVEWDRISQLSTARDEGWQAGRQEESERTVRNALAKGYTIGQIHDLTGLDMETIAGLQTRQ